MTSSGMAVFFAAGAAESLNRGSPFSPPALVFVLTASRWVAGFAAGLL